MCAELPELADLQAHLSVWCAAQDLPTALPWVAEEPESSSVAPMSPPGWLIHGSTCRAEALVEAWSASHPAATAQVWRLPTAFDAEQVLAAMPPELNAAWQREALAEAFVDALAAAQPGGWLMEVDAPGSTCLRQLPLAEAVHYPRVPVEAWLERLREALDFYDEDLVRRELEGAWG